MTSLSTEQLQQQQQQQAQETSLLQDMSLSAGFILGVLLKLIPISAILLVARLQQQQNLSSGNFVLIGVWSMIPLIVTFGTVFYLGQQFVCAYYYETTATDAAMQQFYRYFILGAAMGVWVVMLPWIGCLYFILNVPLQDQPYEFVLLAILSAFLLLLLTAARSSSSPENTSLPEQDEEMQEPLLQQKQGATEAEVAIVVV